MERPWVSSPSYEAAIRFLIEARQAAGLSQRDLAGRLGKPRSWVSKVEGRERRLDVVEFVALAEAVGIAPGELMALLSVRIARPLQF